MATPKKDPRIKTTLQFKLELAELVNEDYTLLGEYVKARTKTQIRHNLCGTIYEVSPNAFLSGHRCPACTKAGPKAKSTEQFKQEMEKIVGASYQLQSPYLGVFQPIQLLHQTCETSFVTTPNTFLSGEHCPACRRQDKLAEKQLTFEEKKSELTNDAYVSLSPFAGLTKPMIFQHECGQQFETTPAKFLKGHHCPRCAPRVVGRKRKKTSL